MGLAEVPSEPFSNRYFVPCGTGREKAGAGPRPSNPLLPGSQLHAKNSTFGEWQTCVCGEVLIAIGSQQAAREARDRVF